MQLNKNPMFRKAAVPWYRSRLFCLVIAGAAACLAALGAVGIRVALGEPQYQSVVWVPVLLTAAAGVLFVFALFRAWKVTAAGKIPFSGTNGGLK